MPLAPLLRRLGHQRWFARVFRTLVPVDRLLGRATGGRFVALGLDGLPSLLLTTTGRRSAAPRTSPLLYAPDGDGYVVIGSNWGQPQHPAWTANLLADPVATVTLHGRRIPVLATLATGADRDRLFDLALRVWPAYQTYQHRAAGREIRVFRLAPTGQPTAATPPVAD